MGSLLAVDVGLRFGLAWFDQAGRLRRYRSQHVPNLNSRKCNYAGNSTPKTSMIRRWIGVVSVKTSP